MIKYFFLFLFFTISNKSFSSSFTICNKFIILNNAVILKINSSTGKELNILFDSGTKGFLVDSNVFDKLKLRPNGNTGWVTFSNGSVQCQYFSEQKIFDNSYLNDIYSHGSILDLGQLKDRYGVPIHGILGISSKVDLFYRLSLTSNTFTITNKASDINSKYVKLKMVSSDFNNETSRSKYFSHNVAVQGKILFNKKDSIKLNFIFDTGFNRFYHIYTKKSIETVIKNYSIDVEAKRQKKTSLGSYVDTLYETNVNLISLDNIETFKDVNLTIKEGVEANFFKAGSSDWFALIGMDYIVNKREICIDMINRYIYILNK